MADEMIFPIKIDFEGAIRDAEGKADKVLRQLESALNQKPIKLDVAIDSAATKSIDAISDRMSKLVEEFNKLSEAQRIQSRTSGEFTPEAQKIIDEYAKLTAASQTYAQSLSQITAAAKKQSEAQLKAQEQEIKRYDAYWKRKEAEEAKQAQRDIANAEKSRKAQQQRIAQEQAADEKRYQQWLKQKNQEAVETERVERQKQQSRQRTIAQQNREFEAERKAQQQREAAIAASLRAEYQRIEAKKQAEAASRRELQMLNAQYAAEERRQKLAASQASVARRKQILTTLRAEENTITNITAKLQHWQKVLNSSDMDGRQFKRAAEEVRRLSQRLSEAQAKITRMTSEPTPTTGQVTSIQKVTNEYKRQTTYLERLIKRMAVYASIGAVGSFLTKVREVTAEFELQRVSLGAIIQDQNRANQLFSEIKSFALKSPVSILDLTKYTKQLAAYKIGVDELFETTKKLTDVSVGLGVAMDRVVLAYGQTRATGYLRASEIRQFTEMGVPIVEELATKLSKMNGELVTAAQVMDMVSKRAISFEMVKEVFDDMTSAGGMFYNMQEKQGNTLFGLWAKLGDAASVMYDEIGNTEWVNSGMKSAIQLLTDLMKNWESVGKAMGAAAAGYVAIWATNKIKGWQSGIDTARIEAARKVQAAQAVLNAEIRRGTKETITYNGVAIQQTRVEYMRALALRDAAAAELKAAHATNLWSKGWNKLKAAFLGNWVTLLIGAVVAIGMHFYDLNEKANRLKNALKEIAEESGIEQMKSVRNFESLANMAVKAADGSKQQKQALDELARTYRDIIPQERLTIENLRAMKGNYDSLTQSIKNYVAEQMKQKQVNTIIEVTGREMIEQTRNIQDIMKDTWNPEQIARFMAAYEQIIRDNPAVKSAEAMKKAAEDTGIGWQNMLNLGAITRDKLAAALRSFSTALKQQVTQVEALNSAWANNYAALGQYGKGYEALAKQIKDSPIEMGGNPDFDENKTPYFFKQQEQNLEILRAMIPTLQKIMSDADVAWQDGWANIVETIDTAQPQIISSIDFNAINQYLSDNIHLLTDEQRKAIEKLQAMYLNIGIPSEVVRYNRKLAIDLANKMEEALSKMGNGSRTALDNVTKYFMTSGQSVKDYAKVLDDTLVTLKDRIAEIEAIGLLMSPESRKELEDLKTAAEYVEKLRGLLNVEESGRPRTTADPRIGILKEMVQLAETLNNEYREMAKLEGGQKALGHVASTYAATIKDAEATLKKHGLSLPALKVPTNASELRNYLKAVQTELAKLPKSDKEVIALGVKIDKNMLDESQREIEKQLKTLSDQIARSKTAQEFFDKILDQTGDVDVAINMTTSVYGTSGGELQSEMANYIRELFGDVDVDMAIEVGTDNVDYVSLEAALNKNLDVISEKNAEIIRKLIEDGKKANAAQVQQWFKDIKAAEDFADKRVKLARETANRIAEVEAQARLQGMGEAEQKALIDGYTQREDKEAAKLEYEAFKEMPMYVQLFSDLDNASTAMLTNMRNNLQRLQGKWQDLDPTELKELQSRLSAIEKILVDRNPFKALGESISKKKEWKQWHGDVSKLEAELNSATQEWLAYSKALTEATAAEANAKASLENAKVNRGDVKAAKEVYDAAKKNTAEAAKHLKSSKQELEILQQLLDEWKKLNDEEEDAGEAINKYIDAVRQALRETQAMVEAWSGLGNDELWNTIMDGLDGMLSAAESAVTAFTATDPFTKATAAVSAITGLVGTIGNLFYGARVAKANKEIERQQKIIDQLEYSYNRLENAIDDAFGTAYLQAYRQQLQNLQAQQNAYLKQAEAERSKGKKADKDKIEDYENSARDAADAIADMQGTLAEKFLGSDLASAARDFAQAWLDAYKEFGNTADAMSEKFQEMIQNMIVESLLGSVMEKALKPAFDMIDNMKDTDFMNQDFWKSLTDTAAKAAQNADAGAYTMMAYLEQAGITMRDLGSDLTGISRDVASASEESINGLAAAINTQNFYISQQLTEVRLIREAIVNRGDGGVIYTDLMAMQNEHLSHLPIIAANTAATVERCERAAIACEDMATQLKRVIRPKQAGEGTYVLNAKVLK